MKTEPLQSLGPDRVVAVQHVVMHAPHPPDVLAAPASPAVTPLPEASGGGCSPCRTGVGPLTSDVTDGDGCVWSCGFPAVAAGTPTTATRAAPSAAARPRFANTCASLPLSTPTTAAAP